MHNIPQFVIEMSKRMNSDDNRCTSHPFWQVRHKSYLVTEEGYNEHHRELVGDEGAVYSDLQPLAELHAYLIENHEDWCKSWASENHEEFEDYKEALYDYFDMDSWDWPEDLKVIYMQEIEEIVWTGLTEQAALDFITRKQHDYPRLYTYVESAYWSPELKQLQDWIKSLTQD
jgi:hypothetical protein